MVGHLVGFAAGLAAMTVATIGLLRWSGAGLGWAPLLAIVRASLQLGVVALLLRGILTVPETVVAFVVLMLATASWTASGRLSQLWGGRRAAVLGVCAGALSSLVVIFGLHLVDLQVRYVVSIGGIIIGSAMNASSLSGRNFQRAALTRAGEVEAWLAVGATPSQAYRAIGQESVRESLIPNLDQTRSTGLVTLPGAFVGALFGGADPQQAAEFQLVVLAGIALAMTVTSICVTRYVGRSPFLVSS